MPNWAEGSLKIRGKKENVLRFLKEGLLGYPEISISKDENNIPQYMKKYKDIKVDENEFWIDLKSDGGFQVKNAHRAFIEDSQIEHWFEDSVDELEKLEIASFKQAWAVVPNDFVDISKKFNIDIKIFVFERGMEFTQIIEVTNGKLTKLEEKENYNDYFWEVPFSSIGG